MKFRTEIEIAPLGTKIGYENRILALGSCFAEHIAGRLAQAKFRVTANPSGILFNPLSIAAALRSYAGENPVRHSELGFDGELWFHYGFHGSFSAPEADQALASMNAARKSGAEALRAADRIMLTFGTAWVYEHDGAVVANCHRRPAAEFTRRNHEPLLLDQLAAVRPGDRDDERFGNHQGFRNRGVPDDTHVWR